MPITALPTPPSRSDPVNFAARGDALLGALPTFVTEANALEIAVEADRVAAAASASAALASQNSAATSSSNANSASASSAASAAAALAAAAATQAGLPAQTLTNGKVLRSVQGLATWGPELRAATQVVYSSASENEIATSSAAMNASWTKGSNTGTLLLEQSAPGPNGLRSVIVPNSGSSGNQSVWWSYTPQVGVARTFSVWWRGSSKPAVGFLLYLAYRDAGNTVQYQSLPFSDASVIADGAWRRYSVTATHQGATVTPLPALACVDTGTFNLNIADPALEVGNSPGPYVATGNTHVVEPYGSYYVSTVAGAIGMFLPDVSLTIEHGTTVSIKDYGRAASANNITVFRNNALIEDAPNNLEIDINGAPVTLQYSDRKGWLIK